MSTIISLILTVQIVCALVMVGLILIQHGKGADMGAAFGGGSSGSLFGAAGSANFLSRSTAVLATVFFVSTLALAYFSNVGPRASSGSVLEGAAVPVPAQQIPAPASGAGAVPSPAGAVPAPAAGGAASVPAPSAPAPAAAPAAPPATPPASPTESAVPNKGEAPSK